MVDWGDEEETAFGVDLVKMNRTTFENILWGIDFNLADIILYSIIGQLPNLKKCSFFIGDREYDMRVHASIFMQSGAGKGGMFNYASLLCEQVKLNFLSMGQVTDASLIGKMDVHDEYNADTGRPERVKEVVYGKLYDGNNINIMGMNETDILFNSPNTSYSQNLMTWYQKAMNPYKTEDNVISKDVADGRIEYNSDKSFIFISKVPDRFYEVLTSMGFIQRTLCLNIPLTWEQKKMINKIMMEKFGKRSSKYYDDVGVIGKSLREINKAFKDNVEFTICDAANEVLVEQGFKKIHDPLDNMSFNVRNILQQFTSRYQEMIIRISHLNAIMRKDNVISVGDVAHAINFVMPFWLNIIYFIEEGLEKDKREEKKLRERIIVVNKWYKGIVAKTKNEWVSYNLLVKILVSKKYGFNVSRTTAQYIVNQLVEEGIYEMRIDGLKQEIRKIEKNPKHLNKPNVN